MAGSARVNKDTGLTDRQEITVELLPLYDWSLTKAGLAAGFSKSYANDLPKIIPNNPVLKAAIDRRKAEVIAKIDIDTDELKRRYNYVYKRSVATDRLADANHSTDSLNRMAGGFTDKLQHTYGGIIPPDIDPAQAVADSKAMIKDVQAKQIETKNNTKP